MAKQNKTTLKGYFVTGAIPTQQNFADLIESAMPEAQACVVVETTNDSMQNGINLLAAYAAAKVLAPNGDALSATNRACVIVPPGNYCLDEADGSEGFAPLLLDTEFVDIIGLTTNRDLQFIYSNPDVGEVGTIMQTANDVRIYNISAKCEISEALLTSILMPSGEPVMENLVNTPTAYFPETNLSLTVCENCIFRASENVHSMFGVPLGCSTRFFIEFSGTFTNCIGGDASFGGGGLGTASGTFTNCIGGDGSFGGGDGSTASGTFTNCIGGDYSFGSTASGTFTNCIGGDASFGGGGGTASGTFNFCIGGDVSFGGNGGTASGTFNFCRLTSGTFITLSEGGKIRACIDDSGFIAELDYAAD